MSVAAALPCAARGHARRSVALAIVACATAPSAIAFLASSAPDLLSASAGIRRRAGWGNKEGASSTWWVAGEAASPTTSAALAAHTTPSCAGCLASGIAAGIFAAAVGKQGRRQRAALAGRRAENKEEDDEEKKVPFELRGFSLSYLALAAGITLTTLSFLDYTVFSAAGSGLGLGGLGFIYAIPATVLGLSLLYAEIPPVEVETGSDATGLFDEKATPTLIKIKSDVTRHRYGDDAHLDTSLRALGLDGTQRYPQLKRFIESKSPEGELEITLLFESKDVPFTTWSDPLKIVACDRFFGPGVWTEISKHSSEKRIASLKLTTGSRPERAPSPAARTTAKAPATA